MFIKKTAFILIIFLFFTSIYSENIEISAVGDIMMGSIYPYKRLPDNSRGNPLNNLKKYLKSDILFGNLEGTFSTHMVSSKPKGKNYFAFNMPIHFVNYLKEAGFSVLNIANNHSKDFGEIGLSDTIFNLQIHDIGYVGLKDQLYIIKKKGIKIGFIGFYWTDYFNNLNDIKQVKKLISKAKKYVDILVVSFHGGREGIKAQHLIRGPEYFGNVNRGDLIKFVHTAIDSGADLIIGHGPHVLRAMEFYKGKLIVYSLGNFFTYGYFGLYYPLNISMILKVKLDSKGNFTFGKIIPIKQVGKGIPHYDSNYTAVKIIKKLTNEDFKNPHIHFDNDGRFYCK